MNKLDWKYILSIIAIFCLITVSFFLKEAIIDTITWFLQLDNLTVVAGLISAVITILHKVKNKELRFNSDMSLKDFQGHFEILFSFVSTPLTFVIGIVLLKGLYLDMMINSGYFPLFNSAEKAVLLVVAAYLVLISIIQIFDKLIDVCKKPVSGSVKPLPKK